MIQTTADIIRGLQIDQDYAVSKLLEKLINEHRNGPGREATTMRDRYLLKNAEIYSYRPANYEKVSRRIANDFFADIVDTKTGYMGNEITVSLDKNAFTENGVFNETAYNWQVEVLTDFQRYNYTEDLNSEVLRGACITGCDYRLLYVDTNGRIRLKNLPAREVIYIYDQSIDEPQLAIRYYEVVDKSGAQDKTYTFAEWYTDKEIRYYVDDGRLSFSLDVSRGDGGKQPHMFGAIPIIPFPNNTAGIPEAKKVIDLIDAYDAIMSATGNEIEQLRLAYMYLKGVGLNVDNEFMKQVEQTGAIALEEGGEAGFITKELAVEGVKAILDEIRRNIYQFAKSIDMSKDFGGDMRVIGWQVALLNLENSCKITERKFRRALERQYELITGFWRTYNVVDIDPYNLEFTFTRNFPRDLHGEAETLNLLLGAVSRKTAYAQMSFIDDPDDEILAVEAEGDPYRGINGDTGLEDERGADDEENG